MFQPVITTVQHIDHNLVVHEHYNQAYVMTTMTKGKGKQTKEMKNWGLAFGKQYGIPTKTRN